MLGRVAPRTLRLVSAQRAGAIPAVGAKQHIRPYSDKPSTGSTGAEGNKEQPKQKSAPPSSPLSSLLGNLGSQGSAGSGGSSPAAKTPNFSKLLSAEAPMKGDFAGFVGTGRFGGVANRIRADEDEDPMTTLVLHVHASSNNTILSLTDYKGRVLVNASGGTVGFRKAQRAGFEAAYQATASIASIVKERGINVNKVELRLKGFGAGRDAAFKAVHSMTNWIVCRVVDTTPIPFNGCRPKKARRL